MKQDLFTNMVSFTAGVVFAVIVTLSNTVTPKDFINGCKDRGYIAVGQTIVKCSIEKPDGK